MFFKISPDFGKIPANFLSERSENFCRATGNSENSTFCLVPSKNWKVDKNFRGISDFDAHLLLTCPIFLIFSEKLGKVLNDLVPNFWPRKFFVDKKWAKPRDNR